MPNLPEEIIQTAEELTDCCQYLASCSYLGFDTEFVGEETYHPRLCLVQIATPEKLLIIDPLSAGPLDELWEILLDPDRVLIVHAGREEVRLCKLWTGKVPPGVFDLQIAAGLVGCGYPLGYGALVQQMLDVQMPKGETLTEWRDRPLTKAQIQYAFDDVRYLIPLWEQISQRLEDKQRLDWAQEEFARLSVASIAPPSEEKYRRLKGSGSLDRRRLAILRALFYWREDKAEELNRPARTIVRDDLLVEIARRNPRRGRDLEVVRGLARRFIPEIMEEAEKARNLPVSECPEPVQREQDSMPITHMSQILSAVLGDWATRNGIASNLVATSRDVKLLVRAKAQGRPFPESSLLTQGWRKDHVLPHLEAMLNGNAHLRIANPRSDRPFVIEPLPENEQKRG